MPIPYPSKNEKQNDFISRCMTSLKNENKPHNVKLGICFTTYKRAKNKNKSKGSDEEPNWDDYSGEGFLIKE